MERSKLIRLLLNDGTRKDMKIKQLLFDNQELVRRNYQLIKLDSIAPIPFEMEELVLNDEKLVTMNIIRAIS